MVKLLFISLSLMLANTVFAANIITVHGQGSVTAVPDIATFDVRIQTQGKLVSKLKSQVDASTSMLIKILSQGGVEDKDIQSMMVSIYPLYQESDRNNLSGYQVSRTVHVTLRHLDSFDLLIDKASRVADVMVQNVSLTLADRKTAYRKALNLALEDATSKAGMLAQQGNVAIGRLSQVVETSNMTSALRQSTYMSEMRARGPSNPGQISVNAMVTVTFTLE